MKRIICLLSVIILATLSVVTYAQKKDATVAANPFMPTSQPEKKALS